MNKIAGADRLIRLSQRGRVEPFIAMDVLAEANRLQAEGRTILHLEVGQPSTKAPALVLEAAARALQAEKLGYSDALGMPALRRRIARHYADSYGVEVSPDQVAVTTGSSGGFILSFLACLDHGQSIALPMPGYPAYFNILDALGINVVPLETTASTRWMPDIAMLERAMTAQPFQALLVASPANPTGTMLSRDMLRDIVGWCEANGVWFISDEIYHGLTYDEPASTAAEFGRNAIVINSFSKYYSMTGWRVGWMVLPEQIVRSVECLAQSLFISVPALSQIAAASAFDATEELEANKAVYAANRTLLQRRLPEIGISEVLPMDGAFYAYCGIGHLTNDSMDFARRLLREAGVACTPGLDFDRARGNRYVRLSFAGSHDEISEALDRMQGWLSSGPTGG